MHRSKGWLPDASLPNASAQSISWHENHLPTLFRFLQAAATLSGFKATCELKNLTATSFAFQRFKLGERQTGQDPHREIAFRIIFPSLPETTCRGNLLFQSGIQAVGATAIYSDSANFPDAQVFLANHAPRGMSGQNPPAQSAAPRSQKCLNKGQLQPNTYSG